MNKSLLELLEEEKKEVFNVRFYRNSADDFCNQAENTVDDCQKEVCYCIAQRYKASAEESEEKLLEIRKELKQYISFLVDL